MKMTKRYSRLSFWNKFAFWGTVASFLGLVATLMIGAHKKDNTSLIQNNVASQWQSGGVTAQNVTIHNYFDKFLNKKQTIPENNAIPPPGIKLIFKNSPLFTSQRKIKITTEINAFRNYLAGLGFETPKETPPIGTRPGGGGVFLFQYPGDPVYDDYLMVGEKLINDPVAWRKAYANYIFEKTFETYNSGKIEGWTVGIFTYYFSSSYTNQRPKDCTGWNNWVNALWDIRNSCGQDFTDRSLFYMSKIKFEGAHDNDFNRYFRNRFEKGALVVDNNFHDWAKVEEILKKHNLL